MYRNMVKLREGKLVDIPDSNEESDGEGCAGKGDEEKEKAEPLTAEQKREAEKVNAARFKRFRRSTNAQVLEIVLRAAPDKVRI